MLNGIDISHNNGHIDWSQVKAAGTSFCIVKATQGHSFCDPMFHAHTRAAQAAGLHVGAYHYFTPTQDATAQAQHFLEVAAGGLKTPCLPPALDLEEQGDLDPADYQASVNAWLRIVEVATKRTPMIYTYPFFGKEFLGDRFTRYPLWTATYRPTPNLLAWKSYAIWQYSGAGKWPGVSGPVDLDRYNGDEAALKAWCAS